MLPALAFSPLKSQLQRRALLKWLGSATASLLFISGCGNATVPGTPAPTATPTPSAEEKGAATAVAAPPLRVAFTNAPGQFDPARMTTIEAYQIAFAIYDALTWVDRELTPQPLLALGWQPARDRLSWTFQLRPNVKFHNGAPLTAKDVVYTFSRLLDPKFNSTFGAVLSFVKSVEAKGEHAVRFLLSAPNAELPFLLGSPQSGIVPNGISTADLAARPMGAGPFQFSEFISGDRLKMARYADYWGAEDIKVQELHFVYLPSFTAQVNALMSGEVELVPDINLPDLPALADHSEISVLEVPSGRYQTVVMQATEPPFTDVRVRLALKYCIDRPALQQAVLQGRGNLGNDHPVAPVSPFWADLPLSVRNIDKARQLLALAGYPNGLDLSLITSSSRPGMVELAMAVSEMARPAGINITVVRVPADIYWTDYGGKVPFHIGNWNFRPTIDETFMIAYHSSSQQNESKWSSPKLDTLIDTARSEADLAKRKALYKEAQVLIREEGATLIPYFRPVLMAMRQVLQGFAPHPTGWLDFSGVQFK
ncbi:MAG: ABC transporter substrate-binding protein [Chloroflexi bacterium]|nr:ABC transporter substrate-binding protein [Chloroflexota bacterium]